MWIERGKSAIARMLPWLARSSHRRIENFARRNGYQITDVLAWGRAYRVDKDGRSFVFKRTTLNGWKFYRDVRPYIEKSFQRLALPNLVNSGSERQLGNWVIRDWFEGATFNNRWSEREKETAGGKGIAMHYVDSFLDLVADLQQIEVSPSARCNGGTGNFSSTGFSRIPQWVVNRA
jgi:hypothetical protein